VKSHYIDLTTQTESSISVSTSDTKIQHDRKTTSQPNASKSDKQTLNIIPSNKVQPSSLIQQQRVEMAHNTSNSNTSSKQSTISASENQSNSKEVRQLEQKLRKKEEQLKIKEAILNENTNDRTRLLDRLYQAET
jgi:hypothetical protein